MKKYIFGVIIILTILISCILLVFSRHNNLTITYIKFSVNPEFIVGVNSKNKVVRYNPLNEKAKVFNLLMFNEKTLKETCQIFMDKMMEAKYLDENNSIRITIITKNNEKESNIYKEIASAINNNNKDTQVILLKPTVEDLLSYSNETVYQNTPFYNNDDLYKISKDIYDIVDKHIIEKINALNIDKLNSEQKIEKIKNSSIEGYFKNFDISTLSLDYPIKISNRSSYDVKFIYNDDYTYKYNISLSLEFDYYQEIITNDIRSAMVDVYQYQFEDDKIINYKDNFYKFNY